MFCLLEHSSIMNNVLNALKRARKIAQVLLTLSSNENMQADVKSTICWCKYEKAVVHHD